MLISLTEEGHKIIADYQHRTNAPNLHTALDEILRSYEEVRTGKKEAI